MNWSRLPVRYKYYKEVKSVGPWLIMIRIRRIRLFICRALRSFFVTKSSWLYWINLNWFHQADNVSINRTGLYVNPVLQQKFDQKYRITNKTGYKKCTGSRPEVCENLIKAFNQAQKQRCMLKSCKKLSFENSLLFQ